MLSFIPKNSSIHKQGTRMRKALPLLLLVLAHSHAQVATNPHVRRAMEFIKEKEIETVNEQVKICEIPAPSFKEQVRAAYLKQRFVELGLNNVRIDAEGNVIGERPGETAQTTLVLAAHLDTVFPEGTDVKVSRAGTTLKAPGIGDDTRGLAVLLAVVRAMNEAKISTHGTIIFVANVGEEGLGDLRGTRHLFSKELKGKITHFISIDGTGHSTTNRAVGSNRYKITYHGPGGHSYGAFGLPNPIHALGRAIEKISRFKVPSQPKTTFNVGRIGGGTSVNSIAYEAWMEVDMRSESPTPLASVDSSFKRAVQLALDEENAFWNSQTKLTVDVKLVGERPTGEQPADAPIVRVAMAVDSSLGIRTRLNAGSTDSNIPISLGIPAITIGGGGQGRGAHSPDESFDSTDSYLGTQRVLLIILGIVGVK
jgi:acetylornithine deacetylase/succinyl-diaminopimelate desuccinylase-like protein